MIAIAKNRAHNTEITPWVSVTRALTPLSPPRSVEYYKRLPTSEIKYSPLLLNIISSNIAMPIS